MTDWYNLAWTDVVNLMQSNATRGLLQEEVVLNREKYGVNKVVGMDKSELVKSIGKQILKPWTISMVLCTAMYLVQGAFVAAAVYFILLTLGICMSIIDKYGEHKNLKTLERFNSGECTVIRNGLIVNIKNEELVVGDIVVYKKGSVIPADLRIMDCEELSVKEDAVTGDGNIIDKYSARLLENDLNLSEMRNILFKSSVIMHGSGEGIVVAVGMNTEIGKIMERLLDIEKQENLFTKGITRVVNVMAVLGFIGTAFALLNGFKNNREYLLSYSTNILTASLPCVIVISLLAINAITKIKFKRKDVFFKNISKVQMSASIDVLIIDKEGALTTNGTTVKSVYDNTVIQHIGKEFERNHNIDRILEVSYLCNDITNENDNSEPIEAALRRFVNFIAKDEIHLYERNKRIFKTPYDKEKRIKTTVNRVDRKYRAYAKGAVDALIEECTHIMKNGIEKEITPEDIEEIKIADIEMSNASLNVIGVAYRNFGYRPSVNENIESNLIFAGLVGINSPIKEDVAENIKNSKLMALKPVLFTEDSKLTAIANGKNVGLLSVGEVVMSGIEMDYMEAGELERNIEKISIFSRILSQHKIKIVSAYNEIGYNVALAANKLTDLPALKKADLSISHGEKCSEVLKKLSDVYLKKYDFNELIMSIYDSKNIINSINYIVEFFCTSSLSIFLFAIISLLMENSRFLSSGVTLWLNIVNTFILSMAIFSVRKTLNSDIREKKVINEDMWRKNGGRIVLNALIISIIAILAQWLSTDINRSCIFSVFAICQLMLVIRPKFIKNLVFDGIFIFYILINLVVIKTPVGKVIIGNNFMSFYNLFIVIGGLVAFAIILLVKNLVLKREYEED